MLETLPFLVTLKRMEPFRIACISHEGPWTDIGLSFLELVRLLSLRQVRAKGPFLVLHDRLPSADSFGRLEVGVPVAPDTRPGRGLRVRDVPGAMVASTMYDGPPSRFHELFPALNRWIEEQGYVPLGPVREIYAPDISDLPPGLIHAEVQVPVRRRRGPS